MNFVHTLFDKLLLNVRERHLSHLPAETPRLAALGFAPMAGRVREPRHPSQPFFGTCICGRYGNPSR